MARHLVRTATLAGSLTLALGLSGCAKSASDVQNSASGSGGSGSKATVTVLVGSDTNVQQMWEKSIIPGFEQANPGIDVKVNFDLHGEHDAQNLAKLGASVKQNKAPGFDIIDAGFVTQAADSQLLEAEGPEQLKPLAEVDKTVLEAGKGFGVPYRASAVLLAYDSAKVDSPPQTLDALLSWIKAHPGKFAYNSPKSGGSGQAFVTTVLDANMPQSDADTLRTSADEAAMAKWDKGFGVLKQLGPSMYGKGVYPNGNSQVLDLLSSGQISMAPVWSDMYLTAKANGQLGGSVKATQISDPSFTGGASYLGLAKNSPHKEAAQKLLDYTLTPQAQAAIAKDIAGFPVIPLEKLPQDVQDKLASGHPETLRPTYYSEVANELNNQWDQKVPGQ